MKVWFSTCPRCKGDLIETQAPEGLTIACITCGHELNPFEERFLRRRGELPYQVPQPAAEARPRAREGYRHDKAKTGSVQ